MDVDEKNNKNKKKKNKKKKNKNKKNKKKKKKNNNNNNNNNNKSSNTASPEQQYPPPPFFPGHHWGVGVGVPRTYDQSIKPKFCVKFSIRVLYFEWDYRSCNGHPFSLVVS